jgi:hypothetical protein
MLLLRLAATVLLQTQLSLEVQWDHPYRHRWVLGAQMLTTAAAAAGCQPLRQTDGLLWTSAAAAAAAGKAAPLNPAQPLPAVAE